MAVLRDERSGKGPSAQRASPSRRFFSSCWRAFSTCPSLWRTPRQLTEAGYVGEDVENIIQKLLQAAGLRSMPSAVATCPCGRLRNSFNPAFLITAQHLVAQAQPWAPPPAQRRAS
jgi:hypothetical protein